VSCFPYIIPTLIGINCCQISAMNLKPSQRIPSLDGLRAISIALVLIGHMGGTRNAPGFLSLLEIYANFGVRVFFIISGFLITGLLLREHSATGQISLRDFYTRRFFRIFPAAYVYLTVIAITAWHSLRPHDIAAGFLYLTNYSFPRPWLMGHLWSLAVEEQFYFIWPLLLLMFFRKRRLIVVLGIALPPIIRAAFFAKGLGAVAIENYFPAVADALATGCLLAIMQPDMGSWAGTLYRQRWFVAVPILTVLLPLMPNLTTRGFQIVGVTLMHVGIALCIDNAIRNRYRLLNVAPMIWLGVLSYSLYLWQQPFLNRTLKVWWTAFPVNIIFAFGAASVSFYLVERPFLILRDYLEAGKMRAAKAVAVVAGDNA
jgi:peptidoglycan/LPS O-acetylase OafA/YrhL